MIAGRPLTLAILANEFFDPAAGRMGGFGWAAAAVTRIFAEDPGLGVRPVIVAGERVARGAARVGRLHGAPLVPRTWNPWLDRKRIRRAAPDALLTIDFRPSYRRALAALPGTPLVVWARDPRTPDDDRLVRSVRLPGDDAVPRGLDAVRCTGLQEEVERRTRAGGPVHVVVTDAFLAPRLRGAYGLDFDRADLLPNPLDLPSGPVTKSERPTVVFLGRLDPIKRPWVFAALAARFPGVTFLALGQGHFSGPGSWQPRERPENLVLAGHADAAAKRKALEGAWALVNTSAHEALAVSFLEALAHEVPIVAMVDAGGLVSRFGFCVGESPGTGLDRVDALADALGRCLGDHALRRRLGAGGRAWVARHHGRAPFLAALAGLLARSGVA